MKPLTQTQKEALEWAFAEPCADIVLLQLRSAYAAGHAMVIGMTLDGMKWIKARLDDPAPGCMPRIDRAKIEDAAAVMRQDGLKVEIRG